jgi:hypothetical protein
MRRNTRMTISIPPRTVNKIRTLGQDNNRMFVILPLHTNTGVITHTSTLMCLDPPDYKRLLDDFTVCIHSYHILRHLFLCTRVAVRAQIQQRRSERPRFPGDVAFYIGILCVHIFRKIIDIHKFPPKHEQKKKAKQQNPPDDTPCNSICSHPAKEPLSFLAQSGFSVGCTRLPSVTFSPAREDDGFIPFHIRAAVRNQTYVILIPYHYEVAFSRLTNLLKFFKNTSSTVPVGPFLCLAIIISIMFFFSESLS